jgi:hypothetical protein
VGAGLERVRIEALAGERLARPGALVLVRLCSAYDWWLPAEGPVDAAAFDQARLEQDALAAALTLRGFLVAGILWEPAAYRQWLGRARGDTRVRREEFALWAYAEELAWVHYFTRQGGPGLQPIAASVAQLFHLPPEITGWLPSGAGGLRRAAGVS